MPWSEWTKEKKELANKYFRANNLDPMEHAIDINLLKSDDDEIDAVSDYQDELRDAYKTLKLTPKIVQVPGYTFNRNALNLPGHFSSEELEQAIAIIKNHIDESKKNTAVQNTKVSIFPPTPSPKVPATAFVTQWQNNTSLSQELREKYIPCDFKDATDASKGFNLKKQDEVGPTGDVLMEFTPTKTTVAHGDWATEEEKAQLIIAGFKLQNIPKDAHLEIEGGDQKFQMILQKAFKDAGYSNATIKPEASAAASFRGATSPSSKAADEDENKNDSALRM